MGRRETRRYNLHKSIVHGYDKDITSIFQLGAVHIAGNVTFRTTRALIETSVLTWSCKVAGCWCILKAAGTPMIRPLPFRTLDRLTLFPGDDSMSSTSGMLSPALTKARAEEWKLELEDRSKLAQFGCTCDCRARARRAASMVFQSGVQQSEQAILL